jgi:hypothetical protein
MSKVTQFHLSLINMIRDEDSPIPAELLKLSQNIEFYTKYELSKEKLIKIGEGIVYVTSKFI